MAVVLFTLGGAFALYEGIEKLRHPHELENFGVAIAILLVSVGLEAWSFRTARHEANLEKPKSVGWWRFIRRTKNPELPVVLLEDSGALVGLFFALIGVSLAKVTENPRGRRRQHRDRPPPHRHLDRARRRDEGPAHR